MSSSTHSNNIEKSKQVFYTYFLITYPPAFCSHPVTIQSQLQFGEVCLFSTLQVDRTTILKVVFRSVNIGLAWLWIDNQMAPIGELQIDT